MADGPLLLRTAGVGPDEVERTREALESAVQQRYETLPTLPYEPPPPRLASDRAELLVQAERIEQAWSYGDFPRAAQLALDLDRELDPTRSPWIDRADDRRVLHKALVLGALAHRRLNHTDKARAKMRDARRRFPELAVARKDHGPEAMDLAVESELPAADQITVRVVPEPTSVQVYVNGAAIESGSASWSGLQPGVYRVHLASRGAWTSRSFFVRAEPGQVATVAWDPDLDPRLDLSGSVPVVRVAGPGLSEVDQRRVQRLVLEADASAAVLTAAESDADGWRLHAHRVLAPSADPTTEVRLQVPAEPSQLAAASVALTGGAPAPGLRLADAAPAPPRKPRWPQWVLVGTGVAAAGLGAALVAMDSPAEVEGVRQREARNSAEAGGVLLSVGGGAALTGALWLLLSNG